jgi:hypothetical protein
MSIGALTFLSPWLLAGLAALPVIYWLLRTVPPRPREIRFPATRILKELENREKTPDKTPWWLMLIRLLAAALVIFALANPLLNPNRSEALSGQGPVVLLIDNGWTAAAGWAERIAAVERVVVEAERQGRSVVVVPTAGLQAGAQAQLQAPAAARRVIGALVPQPFKPTREAAADLVRPLMSANAGATLVWFSDGVDHGRAEEFTTALGDLGASEVLVFEPALSERAIGVSAGLGGDGKLEARIIRSGDGRREGILHALSARGERLSEQRFSLPVGETEATVAFDLPLELRNQVTRVVLAGERSAGAVHLLDARSRWNRVGLVSGASQEQAQPLLGPLYYIRRALQPFAEVAVPAAPDAPSAIAANLSLNATVLMLADIGRLPDATRERLRTWVNSGGVLVRFAGARLEQGGDDLLPVPLREGGRTLGGALSWSEPQAMAEFPEESPFVGLELSPDVRIRRQVLADPVEMTPEVLVWARLADGTPLVTARRVGDGHVVLFHITANSDWSNLPLAGLFVDMLRRVTTLSAVGGASAAGGTTTADDGTATAPASAPANQAVIAPRQVLDGFGTLGPAPATAQAAPISTFERLEPSLQHPPGYYGAEGTDRALNLVSETTELPAIGSVPAAARKVAYGENTQTDLKPWLLTAALMMLFIDVLAVLAMQGGFAAMFARSAKSRAASVVLAIVLAGAVGSIGVGATSAHAQNAAQPSTSAQDGKALSPAELQAALAATRIVTFGYVLTGDAGLDGTSRAGLEGLVKVLTARTAVEPGPPVAVDIERDEISFFPILYWPITQDAKVLSTSAAAKLDAYMKRGGMVIFDTRDFGQGIPLGFSQRSGRGQTPLQRVLSRLDIPRLEPVPESHVLTKSFYLLQTFPGRFDGGQLWVEATEPNPSGRREARRADGVSSILITSNDFASAWALDDNNQPMFPVVPGGPRHREFAFRTGVNIVMYALTGNYKADQVHIPSLLQRLGQ